MEKITFFFEKKKGEKEREEEEMKALKEGRERILPSSDDFRLFLSFSLSPHSHLVYSSLHRSKGKNKSAGLAQW